MRDEAGPGLSSSLIPHPFPPEHLTPSFTLFSGEAIGAAASVRLQFGAGEAAMNRHPYLTGLAVIALVAGRALPAAGRLPILWPTISGYAAHPAAPGTRPPGAPIASAAASTQVLILGTNLDITGTVSLNGIPAPPALSRSPTEILVTVPAAPSYPFRGPVTVAVSSYAVNGPEFTITAPVPSIIGYAAANRRDAPIVSAPPGSPLLILGANLGTGGTLAFNSIPAPPALSWSPTEILVTVPAAPSYPFRGPVTV